MAPPKWAPLHATAPSLTTPCIAALDIPYKPHAHRFQTLNVYLPISDRNSKLIGQDFEHIPGRKNDQKEEKEKEEKVPRVLVYIHGGAWRAYTLTARSIEATAAHAFNGSNEKSGVDVIVSINYSLSPSLANAVVPEASDPADPSRNAVHPDHVSDIHAAFEFLREKGLAERRYVLAGHSCGACIAFQAVLSPALRDYGMIPRPAALIGLNGLYDLPQLVTGLGRRHNHLRGEYAAILDNAFGEDRGLWEAASPARFDVEVMGGLVRGGLLVWVDASEGDELAPVNGTERVALQVGLVAGVRVVRGRRLKGGHSEVWEGGEQLWGTVGDVLKELEKRHSEC